MNLLYHLVCLLEVSSVASVCTTCYAESLNLLTSCLQAGSHFVVQNKVCECEVCALRGEFHSDSLTDAAGCSCDKGSLSF